MQDEDSGNDNDFTIHIYDNGEEGSIAHHRLLLLLLLYWSKMMPKESNKSWKLAKNQNK